MSLSSDNFTAIIHLRSQVKKWKNVAFFGVVVIALLLGKVFISSDEVGNNVNISKDYIANISIEGIILENNYRSKVLEKIAKQENIKAVVININSPGGTIVGSEVLYENLRKISKKKPIVVTMGSLAASGGYMVSVAADYIIARNGTLTGSIGVIMQSSEFTNLAEKLGIGLLTYKSSPLKGSPSPFEKTTSEANQVIDASIKDSYKFFSDLVLERRKTQLKGKAVESIIDGRIFTGRQALENGLVDRIGGKDEALDYLKEYHKIDIDKLEVQDVSIKKPESKFLDKLFSNKSFGKIFDGQINNGKIMAILPF